ncbi:MAG: acyl transferase [Bacteroidota bacterium]
MFSRQGTFDDLAAELWQFQYAHNPHIRRYADLMETTDAISIPIAAFKHFDLICGDNWQPEAIFESSGTTGQKASRHLVRDLSLYRQSHEKGFAHVYPEKDYVIFALLPSYLERGNSSLVRMVKDWMDVFGLPGSGFYLNNFAELQQHLTQARKAGKPILLIGVAFALLDFAEQYPTALPPDAIIIETGGMKGRKEEMVRKDLHAILCEGFGVEKIGSEYGMTELLSQAYAVADGRFRCPPWMKVWVSDIHLDQLVQPIGVSGRLHIVDLANVHSCAFIATDDIGRLHEDGSFEVLGRLDNAEMRGCSLMYV